MLPRKPDMRTRAGRGLFFSLPAFATVCWLALAIAASSADASEPIELLREQPRQDLRGKLEFLRDEGRQWTIEEVSSPPLSDQFLPLPSRVWRPDFSKPVLWLRFTVHREDNFRASELTPAEGKVWILDPGWMFFSEVSFYMYMPAAAGDEAAPEWIEQRAGLSRLKENRADPVLSRSMFRIPLSTAAPQTCYVRIVYETPTFLRPKIYSRRAFQDTLDRRAVIYGIYYGIMIAIALFGLLMAPSLHDRSYLWFALHVLFLTLFYMEFNLFLLQDLTGFRLLPPAQLCCLLLCAQFFFLALFVNAFFFSHAREPFATGVLRFYAGCSVFGMLLVFLLDLAPMNNYIVFLSLMALLTTTGAVALSLWRGFAPARLFFLGWAAAGIGLVHEQLISHNLAILTGWGHWDLLQVGTGVYALALFMAQTHRLWLFSAEQERRRKAAEADQHALRIQMERAQKLESLGIMAAGIAHDFNNLLAAVFGNIDLGLHELPAGSPALPYLQGIKRASSRMADLSGQMLDYTGKKPIRLRPVDLSELIEDAMPLILPSIPKTPPPDMQLAVHLPAIQADVTQIRQMLANLVTNAAEAISPEGKISIRTGKIDCTSESFSGADFGADLPAGAYVFLEVSDDGAGMDEKTKARIFDPFFSTKFTGRGLGLASVAGIVKMHHASLRITSAPNRGTTFRVLFPATNAPAEPVERRSQAAPPSFKAGGTLLLVDDDEDLLYLTAMSLGNMGFHVLTGTSGQDALDLYAKHAAEIRAIILDQTMPGMDGIAVLRALREKQARTPVILYSGYAKEHVLKRAGDAPPDAFLQKPFDEASLQQALSQVLGG